jgi:DNA-binding beta-propeller fold protein YncE
VFTPDSKTAYVANGDGPIGTVVPINTATGQVGQPIRIGVGLTIAITPDGKTLYAAALSPPRIGAVFVRKAVLVPISTAANTPGHPIQHVGRGSNFAGIVIVP